MLDAGLEQHLMAHTDGQRRPTGRQPRGDDLRSANGDQARHAGSESPDAGQYQTVGSSRQIRIGGHRHSCTGSGDGPLR